MILAKTADAQRELSRQWRDQQVHKTYLAIVRGVVEVESGTINLPLRKTEKSVKPVVVGGKKARYAVTDYRVLQQFREFALIEARPRTGRMHQVRVHLAAVGLPIIADHHYGSPQAIYLSEFKRRFKPSGRKTEHPLIDRLALHAKSVTFSHPATGSEMTFDTELPKDFARTLAQLEKHGR